MQDTERSECTTQQAQKDYTKELTRGQQEVQALAKAAKSIPQRLKPIEDRDFNVGPKGPTHGIVQPL